MKTPSRCALLLAMALSVTVSAQTVTPAFNPLTFKQGIDGKPNRLLVLGSKHLGGMKTLDLRMLELLLQRLEAYKPQVITIESLSGIECELLQRHVATYQDTWDSYCADTAGATAAAKKATGCVPQPDARRATGER